MNTPDSRSNDSPIHAPTIHDATAPARLTIKLGAFAPVTGKPHPFVAAFLKLCDIPFDNLRDNFALLKTSDQLHAELRAFHAAWEAAIKKYGVASPDHPGELQITPGDANWPDFARAIDELCATVITLPLDHKLKLPGSAKLSATDLRLLADLIEIPD